MGPTTNTAGVVVKDRSSTGPSPDSATAAGGGTPGGGGSTPGGPAGGDLGGSFPSPTVIAIEETGGPTRLLLAAIAAGQFLKRVGTTIAGATLAAVASSGAYSDLSGAPTSLPPSGAASGDLAGTYPGPYVANLQGPGGNGYGIATELPIGYATGGNIQIRFDLGCYDAIALSTNASFSPAGSAGMKKGSRQTIDLLNTSGGTLTLAWPAAWLLANGALPTSILNNSYIRVKLQCTGTTDASILAAYFVSSASSAITSLTGDVTASGPGAAVATLKNTGPGPTSATLANVTIDAQGRVTALSSGSATGDSTVFDVQAYGADPTGAAYSDTAFTNAIAAAVAINAKFKLRIPAGTYKLASAHPIALTSLPDGFCIEGDGSGCTILRWDSGFTGTGIAITVQAAQGQPYNCSKYVIKGLMFLSQDTAATGLSVSGATGTGAQGWCILDDVCMVQDVGAGLWAQAMSFTNLAYIAFRSCMINTTAGILMTLTGTTFTADLIYFDKCYIVTTGGRCLDFEGGSLGFQTVTLADCAFISIGSADCVYGTFGGLVGGSEDWVVRDCYFNPRVAGYSAFNIYESGSTQGIARSQIHDNFFDIGTVNSIYGIRLTNSFSVDIHDNVFAGSTPTAGIVLVGCISVKHHDNIFEGTFTNDWSWDSNCKYCSERDNSFTGLGAVGTPRAAVFSLAGTNNITDQPVATASLPSASSWPKGTKAFVNDSNSTTFAATFSGGSSGNIPVYTDSANWRVG